MCGRQPRRYAGNYSAGLDVHVRILFEVASERMSRASQPTATSTRKGSEDSK